LAVTLFFRDPSRPVTAETGEMVSSADGTVVGIERVERTEYHPQSCIRVSVFMSVFNVHVNRIPVKGTVDKVKHEPGAFGNAMNPESSRTNESNAIWLKTEYGPVTVRQITGMVARRIVCDARPGDVLATGEKFGMIKLGSRVELYIPPEADVCVREGQKVKAGMTIIARFGTNS